MAESEFAQVRNYLQAATAKPSSTRGLLFHDTELYAMFVDLAVRQRDETALRQYAPLAEETAKRDGHLLYQANAHRAWGLLHRLHDQFAAAKTRLNQALVIFEEMDTQWQIGRTLSELAELHHAMDSTDQALDYFSRALTAFETIGARPDMVQTQASLGSLTKGT